MPVIVSFIKLSSPLTSSNRQALGRVERRHIDGGYSDLGLTTLT